MNTGAIARFLHDAGIVDYRPTDVGGDCFIDVVPSSPDALVSVISLGGDVDPTTGETTTDFQIVVRGDRNDPAGPAARAQNITAAFGVLVDAVPIVIAAGTPDEVTALLVTPQAPANSGSDELSRTEWIVRVTVRSTPVVLGLPDTALLETKAGAQAKADAAQAAAVAVFAGHAADTTDVHGIPDTSLLETQSGAQAKADAAQAAAEATAAGDATAQITAHNSDTTDVHGIADTAELETQTGAQAKADAAQSAAEATAATDAATQITAHNAETEGVHGIPDTSTLETQAGSQQKADAAQTAAEATAAATYVPLTQKAAADGVATLDGAGKIPSNQLPALAITESHVVADEAAMLALDAQVGDIAIRTDNSRSFILGATPATDPANWQELLTPPNEVVSVDGRVGAVDLADRYAPASHSDDTTNIHGIEDTARLVRDNAAVEFNPGDAGATPVTITTADGQSANAFLIRRHNGQSLLSLASSGYLTGTDIQASGGLRIGTAVTYNTGDRLVSIENSPDVPTSNPSNGVIVYADGDRLVVRDDRGASPIATEAYATQVAAAAQTGAQDFANGVFVPLTEKAAPDGVATLDATGVVPETQLPPLDYVPNSEKGAADGVATLDANGVVPETQLPPPAGFLGDWQAGEYQPGQLVASNGYLMTPRVTTTASPYEASPFSGNVTNSDWIKIPDPAYPNMLKTGNDGAMDYVYAEPSPAAGYNARYTITHDEVLQDVDGLSIEFHAASLDNPNDGTNFSRFFMVAGIYSDADTPVNNMYPLPSNRSAYLIMNRTGGQTLYLRQGTSNTTIGSIAGYPFLSDTVWRMEYARSGSDIIGTFYQDGVAIGSRTFTDPSSPSVGYRVFFTAWNHEPDVKGAIGDVNVSTGTPLLSPYWRRLATLVDPA